MATKVEARKINDKKFAQAQKAVASGKLKVSAAIEKFGINAASYYSRARKQAPAEVIDHGKAAKKALAKSRSGNVFLVVGSHDDVAAFYKATVR